nr:ATP-binding protein [Acrocarpospora catenulata]
MSDEGSAVSRPRVRRGGDACSGRGLWLVERLADAWGYREHPRGRVVWFEL